MTLSPKFIKTSLIVSMLFLSGCFASAPTKENVEANVQSKVIEIPDEAAKAYKKAITHMNHQQWSQAKSLLVNMTQDYPQLSGPFANLGVIASQQEQWDEAVAYLQKAIEKKPNNVKALNQLGWVYRQQGQFERAEQQYLKAIDADKDYAASYRNIGILYDIYMGNLAKASEHYQTYQSLQSEPDRQVAGWIVDINRRANVETQIAGDSQ
ncbi:tetratricopeptide repeat protein [Bermanella marisrubri]|uniref:TPR repeat protein n=1 Tax=Bermanella marisrubri TaxID=207949 RepID=Q1N0Q0_9GAMM|nr:tetratricopeptide repeat protein [Bermanella marisrubri]EAT11783.1 TPR repeat protein [Oceanobacter sp. RED65] [Bermanella marisrubri]QIZ83818.1 tetratricopeptide repeat protein [Bermanella marisrubri]